MNPVAVAKFSETTCISIFQHLLNTRSQKSDLLELLFIYFEMVEINNQEMLYLHCFV